MAVDRRIVEALIPQNELRIQGTVRGDAAYRSPYLSLSQGSKRYRIPIASGSASTTRRGRFG